MATVHTSAFGALLKQYRQAAGLTQAALAERAGYSAVYIGMLERGERPPHAVTIETLCAALALSPRQRTALSLRAHEPYQHDGTPSADNRLGRPRLVGRTRELDLIEQLLAGEAAPVLLLAGEPGIGKSRLLQETAGRAAHLRMTVLQDGCHRRSGQEPFAPVLGAVERAIQGLGQRDLRRRVEGCDWLARLLPELANTAAIHLPGTHVPPEQERRLMFKAMRRFLANMAGAEGTLLVLDDVQWAGPDAWDLMCALARSARETPLRILAAYRNTEVRASTPLASSMTDLMREGLAQQIELGPLSAPEARELLHGMLDEDTQQDAAMTEQVLQLAGGVPLFLVSCAQAWHSSGVESGPAPIVPRDVAQGIRQRVVALPAMAQEILRVAAVVGRRTARSLLLALGAKVGWEPGEIVAALDAATQARLLEEVDADAYQFAHDLIHEAILEDLSAARRAMVHRQVAEALECAPGEPPVERLAYHYARGGELEKAVVYLELAATRARAQYAHAAAAESYRELAERLDELGRTAQAARAREELAAVLKLMARYDAALEVYARAVDAYRTLGDAEGLARATAQLARMHINRGTPEEGLACLQPLLGSNAIRQLSPHGLASVYVALGILCDNCGRYDEALVAADRGISLASAAGDVRLQGQATRVRGAVLNMRGQTAEGTKALRAAIPLLEAAGDVRDVCFTLNHLAWLCDVRGDFAEAARYFDQALVAAERLGDPAVLASMHCNRGDIDFSQGNWDQTRAHLAQADALLEHVEASWVTAFPPVQLGLLELAQSPLAAGAVSLEHAADLATRTGNVEALRWAQTALAERDLLDGQPEKARARLEPLLDRHGQQEPDVTRMLPFLAWARALTGEPYAELMEQGVARAAHLRPMLSQALWVRALLAAHGERWQEAAADVAQAVSLCRAIAFPYGEGKALYAYGLLHMRRGERALAQPRLRAARNILNRLGERLYGGLVEAALAQI
jgi:tetratricopeptide (TPR) repeat protein/transcriptional regulator with XRE-family HTH domain